ncbi:TPA: hypothetical protein TXJ06_001387 [Streptococcus suis]|nr:hypothetical protein [Streptococcus suis]HEL1584652.1 hypothetical protein [Streptococcus suis]HEL9644767.1 hypothetical protein [Streptococcus suis]
MWTKRIGYITDPGKLVDYLSSVGQFHDYLIGSFSYDSQSASLRLTIEEDCLAESHSNEPALVWDLECHGVTDFRMEDMEGISSWWIYEVLYDGTTFQFQLVNGYFSFSAESISFGIPHKPTTEGHPAITRLQYDYFLQEFEAGMNVDETAFRFETDNQDTLRYIGYSGNEEPYWAGLSDLPDGGRFNTAQELFEAKIYDGQSLKERWSEVKIYSILSLPLDDWLSCVPHSVETHVYEPDDEYGLYINGVELDGFIDVDGKPCPSCGKAPCYLDDYDEHFCPYCNSWMTEDWWDRDEVHYFEKRPLEPALLWKPNKMLRFCQVQFSVEGRPYTYYCPGQTIERGDWVEVFVGKQAIKKDVPVVDVFSAPAQKPPYPLNKIKTVLGKSREWSEIIAEKLENLLTHGYICDLSEEKIPADSSVAYDLLKTPIGNFWLEFNGQPIKMSIIARYPNLEDTYFVEGSYHLKPFAPDFVDFKSLSICTDIDFRTGRLIDNLGGEHQYGNNWQVGDYDIGVVAHPYSYDEAEVDENMLGIPYFREWIEDYQHLTCFSVAWKYYTSDEDLSIWFNV